MREDVIWAAEAHLNGIGAKDISAVPYHPDIVVETPLGPPTKGAAALRQAITGAFPLVKGIPSSDTSSTVTGAPRSSTSNTRSAPSQSSTAFTS
jgi:ketosteroid isomerase-like protein